MSQTEGRARKNNGSVILETDEIRWNHDINSGGTYVVTNSPAKYQIAIRGFGKPPISACTDIGARERNGHSVMTPNTREIEAPDPLTRTMQGQPKAEPGDDFGEKMVINMGPSHPATHGVLRLVLELDGEVVTKATPDVGYLHRGDEKIAENMQYNQFVPYTDRLDYLAPLSSRN
jgi:hypothetical protein